MDNGIGSLLQFIPGFLQLMRGMNNSGQKATASHLMNVTNAMQNPSNPLYQQMYGQYKQQGQQQLGENISQMEGQNRMLSAMGRTPLFSPERQGETAFRIQAAMGPQIGVQAQQQTQDALRNSAVGLMGQSGVYKQLGESQYGKDAGGAANQSLIGLTQLGNFLGQGNNQQRPQTQQYGPPSLQQLYQGYNTGLNAPGGQQGNSLLHMLFGGG